MIGNVSSGASAETALAVARAQTDSKTLAALTELAATDRHVRAHEMAHLITAGPYATGGPSYTYAKGPDGRLYAVGGEVALNTGPDPAGPAATIRKAQVIEAAADAPVDPSSQDRSVAAAAAQMASVAEAQLAQAKLEQVQKGYSVDQSAAQHLISLVV